MSWIEGNVSMVINKEMKKVPTNRLYLKDIVIVMSRLIISMGTVFVLIFHFIVKRSRCSQKLVVPK